DHTLGNILRMELLRNEAVLFAGYKVPHPLNHMIELRVQTLPKTTPEAAVRHAVANLRSECRSMLDQFDSQVRDLEARAAKDAPTGALLDEDRLHTTDAEGTGADGTTSGPEPEAPYSPYSPGVDDRDQRFQEQLEEFERLAGGQDDVSISPSFSPATPQGGARPAGSAGGAAGTPPAGVGEGPPAAGGGGDAMEVAPVALRALGSGSASAPASPVRCWAAGSRGDGLRRPVAPPSFSCGSALPSEGAARRPRGGAPRARGVLAPLALGVSGWEVRERRLVGGQRAEARQGGAAGRSEARGAAEQGHPREAGRRSEGFGEEARPGPRAVVAVLRAARYLDKAKGRQKKIAEKALDKAKADANLAVEKAKAKAKQRVRETEERLKRLAK
ncbi:unnamed protein product, partial [Prorocentrum cordatum]